MKMYKNIYVALMSANIEANHGSQNDSSLLYLFPQNYTIIIILVTEVFLKHLEKFLEVYLLIR